MPPASTSQRGAKRPYGPHQRHPQRHAVQANGCWNWLLSTSSNGYPITTQGGKRVMAHRQAYEEYKGLIPEGMTLDHLCRNRLCINPNHMEVVTIGENIRRSPRIKLTPEAVAAIKSAYTKGVTTHRQIAKQHGVSREHVRDIINGKRRIECQ